MERILYLTLWSSAFRSLHFSLYLIVIPLSHVNRNKCETWNEKHRAQYTESALTIRFFVRSSISLMFCLPAMVLPHCSQCAIQSQQQRKPPLSLFILFRLVNKANRDDKVSSWKLKSSLRPDLHPAFHLEIHFSRFVWQTEGTADQSLAPSALKYRLIFLCQGKNGLAFVIVCAQRQQPKLNKGNVMERIQMPHSDTEFHMLCCCGEGESLYFTARQLTEM